MFARSLGLDDAFDYVKSRRDVISPNASFMMQLTLFEKEISNHKTPKTPTPPSLSPCRLYTHSMMTSPDHAFSFDGCDVNSASPDVDMTHVQPSFQFLSSPVVSTSWGHWILTSGSKGHEMTLTPSLILCSRTNVQFCSNISILKILLFIVGFFPWWTYQRQYGWTITLPQWFNIGLVTFMISWSDCELYRESCVNSAFNDKQIIWSLEYMLCWPPLWGTSQKV